jgi:AraC family transcriptional regulator
MLRSVDQHSRADKESEQSRHDLLRKLSDFHAGEVVDQAVEIFPSDAVARRRLAWDGMAVEVVQALTHDKVEFRFRGPLHLLVAYEEGIRCNGETLIEGLASSTQRDIKRIPADHEYREWQEPRTRGRIVYFYFDPAKTPLAPSAGPAGTALAPRLFFEDNTLWETAVKMAALIENGAENRQYCEALGVVLAHELMRRSAGARRVEPPARGGLAAWQQRIVSAYIEEHIPEQIPLATLARFVRLSAYHFCRAFKQSFGMPPHRYHNVRRIEHAKMLLAEPTCSVTEIALKVGFSETSSFTAAFRRATGSTPTAYRRGLA